MVVGGEEGGTDWKQWNKVDSQLHGCLSGIREEKRGKVSGRHYYDPSFLTLGVGKMVSYIKI